MTDTWIDDAVSARVASLESQQTMYRQWIETFNPASKPHSAVADWARDLDRVEQRLEEARIIIAAIKDGAREGGAT